MDCQAKYQRFNAVKTLQKISFIHPVDGENFSIRLLFKHYILFLVATLPILVGVHGYAYNVYSAGLFQKVFESLYYSTVMGETLIVVTIYIIVRKRLWRVIDRIGSDTFGLPQALVTKKKNINKMVCIVYCSVFIVDVFMSVYYYVDDKFCEARRILNDTRYRCGYHTSVWYPFEEDKYFKDWILKLWFDLGQSFIFPMYIATLTFLVGILTLIPDRLRDLRNRIEQIDHQYLHGFQEEFKYIAKYYIEILECSKEMNDSLGYILTSGYTSASFSLSIAGYIVILGRRYGEGIFLIGSYALQMVLCRYGQNWEDEHEKLVRSLFNLPWYKMTPRMRKDYQILLGTVKIPIRVIGQPFVIINNNLLLVVTRRAYSVLTFLSNTTD